MNLIILIMIMMFRDVLCGTLHCQGGLDKPIVDGGVTHINMQVNLSSFLSIIIKIIIIESNNLLSTIV